jgi:hypothetical protein
MDFLRYINAVRKHWWVLMSCAFFTVLGAWILYADKSNAWAIRATFAVAGICLLWAGYLAWLDEYTIRIQCENELEARKPSFELAVANLNREFNADRNETNYMFSVVLINRGASSVALGWQAVYQREGEPEEVMTMRYLGKPYILAQPDGEVILTNASLIQSKTLTTPLSTGDARTGRLFFTLPENRLTIKDFKVEISCFDFKRKKCTALYVPAPNYTSGIQFFPDEQVNLTIAKDIDKQELL